MALLSPFVACGSLFGLAMPLASLFALALCLRATFRPSIHRLERIALTYSFIPVILGLGAALTGLLVNLYFLHPGGVSTQTWLSLVSPPLYGLALSAPPLAWSLALLRRRTA